MAKKPETLAAMAKRAMGQRTMDPPKGKRTRKAADSAGPKPGSSRSNQSAKYSDGSTKPGLVGKKVLRANDASRDVQGKLPGQGKSVGHMARGINSRDAPHSSAALQDNRAAERKAAKAPAAPKAIGKTAKVAAKKQAKMTGTDDRKVTIVDKKFTFGAPGTARRAAWDAMASAKTVADYMAAGGKAKYLGRWQAAGAIRLG